MSSANGQVGEEGRLGGGELKSLKSKRGSKGNFYLQQRAIALGEEGVEVKDGHLNVSIVTINCGLC